MAIRPCGFIFFFELVGLIGFISDQKWIGFFQVNSLEQTEIEKERKYSMEEITKALMYVHPSLIPQDHRLHHRPSLSLFCRTRTA
jgi:hypothetical protein